MSFKCRTCMSSIASITSYGSYHIFDTNKLAQKLIRCLSIVIDPLDHYPQWICRLCYDKILDFWDFQEKCYNAIKQWERLSAVQKENMEEKNIRLEVIKGNTKENVKAFKKKVQIKRSCKETELDSDGRGIKEGGVQLNYEEVEVGKVNNPENDDNIFYEENHPSRDKNLHKCDIIPCERVYKSRSALNIHKRTYHKFGPELRTHMCEKCGKVFKSSAVLNEHRFTHVEKSELPFPCEEPLCAKRFSSKEKLKIHKMRHAGIKNFVCPHCGMRKTTRNELKTHINYHTLERTWPCGFCDKVCNSSGNLKIHVRNIHEKAKDYGCRFCDRTFAKPDTRKYHEMTHTGEKPHACEICGRRFLQPVALRTHRKIHLRENKITKGDEEA